MKWLFLAIGIIATPVMAQVPSGYSVRAKVSTCPPYNPSGCQYKTVFLDSRSWCGKRARWWTPAEQHQVVTVQCQ